MHTLISTFFAAIFTFCHPTSVRHVTAQPVPLGELQRVDTSQYVPTRQEIAWMQTRSGYAERGCISSRKTSLDCNVR